MQDTYNECYNKYFFVNSHEADKEKALHVVQGFKINRCIITALQTEVFV